MTRPDDNERDWPLTLALATLAGLAIGPVVALSDGSAAVSQFTPPAYAVSVLFARSDFLIGNWINPAAAPGCYMAVTFQLLRY